MKPLSRFWGAHWREMSAVVVVIGLLSLLFIYKLGSLTHGLSQPEIQAQLFSSSWRHIAHDPLFLPLHAVQWIFLTLIPHHGATITRLPSVCFGALTLGAFAYILRRWYGIKTALYGTVFFTCSAWLLHMSRFAGNDILYLWAVPTLLALQLLWERHSRHFILCGLLVTVLALLLYIPGVIWFVIVGASLQPQLLSKGWQQAGSALRRTMLIVLFLVLLVPLGLACLRTPTLLNTWIGLPKHFDTPVDILKRLGLSATYLFYRGPLQPLLWLDRQPVLNIFGVVSTVLGIIFYARHLTAPRTRQLLGLFIIGAIFFALQGPVMYSVLVPVVYLVAVAGIGYLLHEWLRVFPRNPLARTVGYALLSLVIALACIYDLRSYFIAWPHNQATRTAFTQR